MPPMLSLWRRHLKKCSHRKKGRAAVKCSCPIWCDGELQGKRVRQSLDLRDWQRAIKRIATMENPEARPPKSVAQAIEAFLEHCRELAPSTLRKYSNIMRQLGDFCRRSSIRTMDELTVDALDHYRANRGIVRTTSLKELQTLRQFCGFCVEREWLKKNVAKQVKPPKNVKPEPVEPYTAAEVTRIVGACEKIGKGNYERRRARAMILLLRYTGLRISDVATLGRDRFRDGRIILHTQKTGGLVLLPIPLELQRAIDALPAPRNAPFGCPGLFWNGITSRRAVVGIAERTLAAVFQKSEVPNAHAHRFRHTLATEILTKGGSIQDVADVLGISAHVAAKHYAKWTQARQQRILDLMQAVHAGTYMARGEIGAVIQ